MDIAGIVEELEELFKSETFAKSVNRRALNLLFRNTAIIEDPYVSQEHKRQAYENIKAIIHNIEPKSVNIGQTGIADKKPTARKQQLSHQQIADMYKPKPVTPKNTISTKTTQQKYPFPEDFHIHHGVDPVKFRETWDAMTPEQQKITLDWHKEQLAAKNIKKSLDKLYQLFETLKKQL
ncbi:MAG: hypothetical protein QXG63_06120 [Nitrososphaerales archaeon]